MWLVLAALNMEVERLEQCFECMAQSLDMQVVSHQSSVCHNVRTVTRLARDYGEKRQERKNKIFRLVC